MSIFIFAFFLTMLSVITATYLFPKIGLMDRPQNYGILRKPIPYYGGLAIFPAFLITVLLFVPMSRELIGVLLAGGLIFVVGFLDDYFHVKPILRLLAQVTAALVLVVFGIKLLSFNLPFLGEIPLEGVMGTIFIVFWVLIIVNAMNFIDGVSGLNSGVTAISALIIYLLSVHPGIHEDPSSQIQISNLALSLSGTAFAFLFFDFPKPSILMGDSGSTFFGFMLAVLAIFSGGKVATAVLLLGLPLIDLLWVVFRRTVIEKKKFWQGDLMHFHHRLMYFGLKEKHVVLLYLFVSAIFGTLAVFFVSSQQKFYLIIVFLLLLVFFSLFVVFGRKIKKFEIRKFTKEDFNKYENGFLFLSKKVWPAIGAEAWTRENFLSDYDGKWEYSSYIYFNDKIVALFVATLRSEKDKNVECFTSIEHLKLGSLKKPYINKIAILPEYQGFGLGKALVLDFVEKLKKKGLKEIKLSVNLNNERARAFYEKMGFELLSEEERDEGRFYVLIKKI